MKVDNFFKKVLKRENGSQVKIEVSLYFNSFRNTEIEYEHSIYKREKGKRKWIHIPTSINNRLTKDVLLYVTAEEIAAVKKEFWKKIKPTQQYIEN